MGASSSKKASRGRYATAIYVDLAASCAVLEMHSEKGTTIGGIGALMNRVLQPRPLVVLGLTVWMGTAAGADELVEIPAQNSLAERPRRTPFFLSTNLEQKRS